MTAALVILLLIVSCKKDKRVPTIENSDSEFIKIGETWINGVQAKVTVYGTGEMFAGYNKLYFKFTDSLDESELTNGNFSITPVVDSSGVLYMAPVESTGNLMVSKYYTRNVIFIVPSSNSNIWTLRMWFHNARNNKEGLGLLPINVKDTFPEKIKSVIDKDSSKIFIAYLSPDKPSVGMNDFEIVVYGNATDSSSSAASDYEIEINPQMPDMGHGSPDNVNPVHSAQGHYIGKVNLTMQGLWRIHLRLKKNGVVIVDDTWFDITL